MDTQTDDGEMTALCQPAYADTTKRIFGTQNNMLKQIQLYICASNVTFVQTCHDEPTYMALTTNCIETGILNYNQREWDECLFCLTCC